jgi:hypothetical protein
MHYTNRIEEAQNLLKAGEMSSEQFLVYLKRMSTFDLSYSRHMVISDVVKKENGYVTIIYHVITTKGKELDYGGPNKFNPLLLYKDNIKNMKFFVAPITYLQKFKEEDYNKLFFLTKKKNFKDSEELQIKLVNQLKDAVKTSSFVLFDVNKDCLDLVPKEIDINEKLPISTYNNITD